MISAVQLNTAVRHGPSRDAKVTFSGREADSKNTPLSRIKDGGVRGETEASS